MWEENMKNKDSKPSNNRENEQRENSMHAFIRWDREAQLQAFFNWLPPELHKAPDIDWSQLPPKVMGYCIRTIRDSPDAASIAIAIASAIDARTSYSFTRLVSDLNNLFKFLRLECDMNHIQDLYEKHVWNNFIMKKQCTDGVRHELTSYASIEKIHYPRYLQRITDVERLHMQTYVFPPMPHEILSRHFPYAVIGSAAE